MSLYQEMVSDKIYSNTIVIISPHKLVIQMHIFADNVSVKIQANMSHYESSTGNGLKMAIDKSAKQKVVQMVTNVLNTLLNNMPATKPFGNSKPGREI